MTTNAAMVAIFWTCLAGLFYIYAGYPLLVWVLACRTRNAERGTRNSAFRAPHSALTDPTTSNLQPPASRLSVVIVGYNESARLSAKIASILGSHDAALIGEVIVASDGSTDDTPAVIAAIGDRRVRLVHFDQRRGKPAVLNDVVPTCAGEIIVLTDARQELHPDAIGKLAANFADPAVGVVSGELVFRESVDASTAAQGIGIYWKYEKFIRKCESRFRSVPGATGALYALRKPLFRPIDERTLLDDVVIPMQAVVKGYRCLFEPQAIAWDTPSNSPRQEAIRKRRTIAGSAQLIAHHPAWLLPWKNPIWFEYVSHKIARLFSPLLLAGLAAANVALAAHPLYRVILALHGCFYLSAAAGWAFQKTGKQSRCFAAQLMFLTLNLTTIAALWDAARGRFSATWKRAA